MLDILFIAPSNDLELRTEVNGTMLLATKLLENGFSTEVLRFAQIEAFAKKEYNLFISQVVGFILEKHPRCVSFYTLWPYYHIMLRLAKEIKKADPGILDMLPIE